MPRKTLLHLAAGFRKFRERYFELDNGPYQKGGQSPKSLIIACSDSRVDPAIITSAGPGELFVVRNIANMVPPFETGGGYHGVSAAIEFAVVNLKVENVIVLGHRQCGGIRALVTQENSDSQSFVDKWVTMARPARSRVLAKYPDATQEDLCQHCELESIKNSLANLRTFPFVAKAEKERGLKVIGAYFDLEKGRLLHYDEPKDEFVDLNI